MKRKNNIRCILTATMGTLLLMSSCKDSYPGLDYQPNPDEVPSNNEDLPVEKTPIKLYTNNPGFFSLTTRGTGAFDPTDNSKKYLNSVFHVFAFRVGTGDDGTGGQGPIANTVNLQYSAYSDNQGFRDNTNEFCLLDGHDYALGMPYRFIPDDNVGSMGGLTPVDEGEYYYSGTYQDVGYTFFGYHIDDFQPVLGVNAFRSSSEIYYDVDLDGCRDIMVGYAEPLKAEDFKEGGTYWEEVKALELSDEEIERILSMHGGYSSFAGHRHIDPILRLKHQLARFKFQAYPGDISANQVCIDSISITGPVKGKLVVAGRKHGHCSFEPYTDVVDECWLSEATDDGSPFPKRLREEGYVVHWEEGMENIPAMSRPMTQIGSSLLMASAKSYKMNLYYSFTRANGEKDRFKAIYTINPPKNDNLSVDPATGERKFMPGVLYNIKIAVYGLQEIKVSAQVDGWLDGGIIGIDPDQEPDYQDPDAQEANNP